METVTRAYQDGIHQIVSDLFLTMLATEVSPAPEGPTQEQDHLTALVTFAGTWKGVLEFECGPDEAVRFAQRFLQSDEFQECNDDVWDTVGELANIIAGNLKALMPAEVKIGTPSIIRGRDYCVRIAGGHVLGYSSFATDAGPFSIRLVEDRHQPRGDQ